MMMLLILIPKLVCKQLANKCVLISLNLSNISPSTENVPDDCSNAALSIAFAGLWIKTTLLTASNLICKIYLDAFCLQLLITAS